MSARDKQQEAQGKLGNGDTDTLQ